jgi:hypothetical protein
MEARESFGRARRRRSGDGLRLHIASPMTRKPCGNRRTRSSRRQTAAGKACDLPEWLELAAERAARTLALADAQSVEDLTALLTSAGER